MKNYVPVLLSLFISSCLSAQSPDFSWVKQMGGAGRELAVGINPDASGNIYTSGYFEGTVDFDPGAATNTLSSNGSVAGYISKQDAQGNLLWVRKMDAPLAANTFSSRVTGQALCPNGDICITGSFLGLIDFDPGSGTNYLTAAQASNAFVARFDAQGNSLWAKRLGGTGVAYSSAVAVDALNNVYTTGFFIDTTDFDPGTGTYTLASPPGNYPEAFISKLDASGNFGWARKTNTSGGGGSGVDITLDASGNVYSTGSFIGVSDFDPGVGTHSLSASGGQDAYLWKLDATGNFGWTKAMGGAAADGGVGVITDAAGNVYLSGSFQGTGDLDPGAATLNFTSAGNNDIFYSKFDAQGNQLWVNAIGGTGNDVASALAMDAAGNLFTGGYYAATVDFDAGAGTHSLTAAATNGFISKLDGSGNLKWVKALDGAGYNGVAAVAVDAGSSIYAAGSFSMTTDFDPNAGTQTLTSVGVEDIFILKLVCGNPPDLTASSTATMICASSGATLTASGASTYTWNTNGTNPLAITPVSTTVYTLTGKDANGCSSVINITQQVTICNGLQENQAMSSIRIYPNPNVGVLTVNTSLQGHITIQILNALGQLVLDQRSEQAVSQLNTAALPAGLYFVNVIQDNKIQAQAKLVKE